MYKTPFKVKYDSVVIGNDMLAFWLAIKTPLLYAKLDLLRKDWFLVSNLLEGVKIWCWKILLWFQNDLLGSLNTLSRNDLMIAHSINQF